MPPGLVHSATAMRPLFMERRSKARADASHCATGGNSLIGPHEITPAGCSVSKSLRRDDGLARSRDPELAHAGFERGPLEPEDIRGSFLTTDAPAHPLENRPDVIPLHLLESRGHDRSRLRGGRRELVVQLDPAPRREDDGALDDVLELPDVSRPVIRRELAHGLLADRLDGLAHPRGVRHDEVTYQA